MIDKPWKRCASCQWWKKEPDSDAGQCRALPPTVSRIYPHRKGVFPETLAQDWCGSWDGGPPTS